MAGIIAITPAITPAEMASLRLVICLSEKNTAGTAAIL